MKVVIPPRKKQENSARIKKPTKSDELKIHFLKRCRRITTRKNATSFLTAVQITSQFGGIKTRDDIINSNRFGSRLASFFSFYPI
jgi:hypothetical protein